MVHRIQKGDFGDTFVQDNFYYFCNVENQIQGQKLDDYEDEERFTLEFVSIEDAIKVNKYNHHGEKRNDEFYNGMFQRETKVLEMLQKKLKKD